MWRVNGHIRCRHNVRIKHCEDNKEVLLHYHCTYRTCQEIVTGSGTLYFCHAQLCDCCHSYLQPPSPPSRLRLFLADALQMCSLVYMFVCACVWYGPCPVALWETAVVWVWFCFLEYLSLPLSILRGRKPHGHRATNPLNMSPPPVNKKWPWILQRNAYKQDLAQFSQPISCVHTKLAFPTHLRDLLPHYP